MITPTVGRVVWYWPSLFDLATMRQIDVEQPFTAQVLYTRSERNVNLLVTDHYGGTHFRQGVQLKQEGDNVTPGQSFAEWMPYQLGQAKKHEAEAAPQAAAQQTSGTLHLPKKGNK
jgi:hypothetical protein